MTHLNYCSPHSKLVISSPVRSGQREQTISLLLQNLSSWNYSWRHINNPVMAGEQCPVLRQSRMET